MKKNEIKTGRSKPPEVRTREQQEDQAFNKMLLWLAAAAVVEVVMVLINRYYIHTRVSELGIKMPRESSCLSSSSFWRRRCGRKAGGKTEPCKL